MTGGRKEARSHFGGSECLGVPVRLLVKIFIIFRTKLSLVPFGKESFPQSSVGQKIVLIEHQLCTCVQM